MDLTDEGLYLVNFMFKGGLIEEYGVTGAELVEFLFAPSRREAKLTENEEHVIYINKDTIIRMRVKQL